MNNLDEISEIVRTAQANKKYWSDVVMEIVKSVERATNNRVVMIGGNFHLKNRTAVSQQDELEILREFYKTVKSQNSGTGAYFLTFSNAVKDALETCDKKLSRINWKGG